MWLGFFICLFLGFCLFVFVLVGFCLVGWLCLFVYAFVSFAGFIKPVSTEVLGVHEMQIGSITVQVITGDITKEDTEVIVNISNPTFDGQGGILLKM